MASLRPLYLLKSPFCAYFRSPYYSLKYFRSRFSSFLLWIDPFPHRGRYLITIKLKNVFKSLNFVFISIVVALMVWNLSVRRILLCSLSLLTKTLCLILFPIFHRPSIISASSFWLHLSFIKNIHSSDSIGKAHQILTLKQKRTIANILSASST